jgi:hypothetical protein
MLNIDYPTSISKVQSLQYINSLTKSELELLPNLKKIILGGYSNRVQKEFYDLANLKILLAYNYPYSLNFSKLASLTELTLFFCHLEHEVEFFDRNRNFNNLVNVTKLTLINVRLLNTFQFRKMTNLECLKLVNIPEFEDFDYLSLLGLNKLTKLEAINTVSIVDVPNNLRKLTVVDTDVNLNNLTSLTKLNLVSTDVKYLEFEDDISQLVSLKFLRIVDVDEVNISNLTNLESLESNVMVYGLENATQLKSLTADYEVAQSDLDQLVNLEELTLEITADNRLDHLTNLTKLGLMSDLDYDISELKSLTKLKAIGLNMPTDFLRISKFPNICRLIRDIRDLYDIMIPINTLMFTKQMWLNFGKLDELVEYVLSKCNINAQSNVYDDHIVLDTIVFPN